MGGRTLSESLCFIPISALLLCIFALTPRIPYNAGEIVALPLLLQQPDLPQAADELPHKAKGAAAAGGHRLEGVGLTLGVFQISLRFQRQ